MIGQQLPQTNEKCYSILQCLMWLFAFFFPPSKHSPGGRGRRTGTVAVARWTCETGAFCLAWLDHQHRPRVWRWLPASLGHAPLRLIRVGTRRREYASLQILYVHIVMSWTEHHALPCCQLPCSPNFPCCQETSSCIVCCSGITLVINFQINSFNSGSLEILGYIHA